ncbi:conserved hypothetical protein [Hyella patelloides LEGE 07179]|uniref:Uncharacterized protein n=1 Tax=Hyella patelloides LEGE 07179 TaxID=945734 RepID=A0A563VYL2_9CYAN|nr:hypothetical protein [Hyella patelloides]VEP16353.1 conserved hypothetical protein [Hyella patelloides LEGE 07179]
MKLISSIVNILQNIGRSLVVNHNEPHIEQKHDRHGNSYWQVYDFTTNKSYRFGSDRDVRAWIEERYHHA